MTACRQRMTTTFTRAALIAAALELAACGPAAGGATAGGAAPRAEAMPPLAPVLSYYLDQTLDAVGDEPSHRTDYLAALKGCQSGGLPTTPLSAEDTAKLGTERRRIWQRPGMRVEQRDTWIPTGEGASGTMLNPCLFTGIKERSIREVRVLPQTLYVIDLAKGTVNVQTQAGPPTSPSQPITLAELKAFEASQAVKGYLKKVGDSHALGQPCALWQGHKPDGSLWFTECAWTGGLKNGVFPLSLLLWRKPATTDIGDKRAITTTAFTVGHLPAGSDEVFKVPAKTGAASALDGAGVQP